MDDAPAQQQFPTPGPSVSDSADSEVQRKDYLARLLEKQFEEIDSISKKIESYKKYKQDYVDLKNLTTKMQEKVRYPYKVPIAGTRLAFVDGHIIHTNELHVLLGYNYFALRSTRQANQIIDRRLNDLIARIQEGEAAKKRTEDWLQVTQEHKRDKEEFVEIIETM